MKHSVIASVECLRTEHSVCILAPTVETVGTSCVRVETATSRDFLRAGLIVAEFFIQSSRFALSTRVQKGTQSVLTGRRTSPSCQLWWPAEEAVLHPDMRPYRLCDSFDNRLGDPALLRPLLLSTLRSYLFSNLLYLYLDYIHF